jgi:DNA-binding CsgD family transcriptional regulator/antitoxin (DNA-binding transcriptional repressor) of toxin-antitoxin stability system
MRPINVAEARQRLPELLSSAQQGESYVVLRHGVPIAEIRPPSEEAIQAAKAAANSGVTCAVIGVGEIIVDADRVDAMMSSIRAGVQFLPLSERGAETTRYFSSEAIDHIRVIRNNMVHLTRRELEVVRLVAEGLTNRQIAERLVLGGRTVEAHVNNILVKLRLSARTQVAMQYMRSNLASYDETTPQPFKLTTRMGYSFEIIGEKHLTKLSSAMAHNEKEMLEFPIPGGDLYLFPHSVSSIATNSPESAENLA